MKPPHGNRFKNISSKTLDSIINKSKEYQSENKRTRQNCCHLPVFNSESATVQENRIHRPNNRAGRNIREKAVAIPVHGELEPTAVRRHQMAAHPATGAVFSCFPVCRNGLVKN